MNYAPIDADGHVMETDDEMRRYLPAPFEGRRALTVLFPSLDGWPRSTIPCACKSGACFWMGREWPDRCFIRRWVWRWRTSKTSNGRQ
jgi:hypothetical protein